MQNISLSLADILLQTLDLQSEPRAQRKVTEYATTEALSLLIQAAMKLSVPMPMALLGCGEDGGIVCYWQGEQYKMRLYVAPNKHGQHRMYRSYTYHKLTGDEQYENVRVVTNAQDLTDGLVWLWHLEQGLESVAFGE